MQLTFASYNIHKAVGLDRRRDPDRIIAVLNELAVTGNINVIQLDKHLAGDFFSQRLEVLAAQIRTHIERRSQCCRDRSSRSYPFQHSMPIVVSSSSVNLPHFCLTLPVNCFQSPWI